MMPGNDHDDQEAAALDHFWDQLAAGVSGLPPDVDPADAATIHAFHARVPDHEPDPRFVARLETHLMEGMSSRISKTVPPNSMIGANGRVSQHVILGAQEPRSTQSRWTLAQLVTAALVLVTLIGSVVALRGPLRLIGQEEQPASIPAISTTLEASIVAEALVASWPADGPPFWVSIQRITFDPGAAEEAGANTTSVGPELFIVESGYVTIDADGPVVVTRGPTDRGAEPATVPAGTVIVLDPGDQLFVPSGVSVRRHNDTADLAGILDVQIVDREPAHHATSVHYQRIMPDKVLNVSPPAPAEIALRRLRLLPGRSLAIRDLPGLQMLFVEDGTLDLMSARGPGDLVPLSRTSLSAGRGIAHFDTTPEVANRSTEPVTLLIATIEPAQ